MCREMGWSWEELRMTPRWVIERGREWLDAETRWKNAEKAKQNK